MPEPRPAGPLRAAASPPARRTAVPPVAAPRLASKLRERIHAAVARTNSGGPGSAGRRKTNPGAAHVDSARTICATARTNPRPSRENEPTPRPPPRLPRPMPGSARTNPSPVPPQQTQAPPPRRCHSRKLMRAPPPPRYRSPKGTRSAAPVPTERRVSLPRRPPWPRAGSRLAAAPPPPSAGLHQDPCQAVNAAAPPRKIEPEPTPRASEEMHKRIRLRHERTRGPRPGRTTVRPDTLGSGPRLLQR